MIGINLAVSPAVLNVPTVGKIENIQSDVDAARRLAVAHGSDWHSFLDWQTYRTLGADYVMFDGQVYNFHRFGLLDKVELPTYM